MQRCDVAPILLTVRHLHLEMELQTALLVIESDAVTRSELRYNLEDGFIVHLLPLLHLQSFTLVVDKGKSLLVVLPRLKTIL